MAVFGSLEGRMSETVAGSVRRRTSTALQGRQTRTDFRGPTVGLTSLMGTSTYMEHA